MLAFVLLANPQSRRVQSFQMTLAKQGLEPARVVAWEALLSGKVALPDVVPRGAIVRLDSPGQEWPVEKLLLARGVERLERENGDDDFECLSRGAIEKMEFERGRLRAGRQWYLGFAQALGEIREQLQQSAPHQATHDPDEIAAMFDKPRCHALLREAGVALPKSLGSPRCFDGLVQAMRGAGISRVFVKTAHGSSASGVVAYQTNGRLHRAVTTTQMVRREGEVQLFNSRRLQVYTQWREIAALIDALCRQRVHVEQWLPKAGALGKTCDLRVLVIGGRACHALVRLSRGPLTNLHLLNERAGLEVFGARLTDEAWRDAQASCEAAMGCFPRSLMGGVDVLLSPDLRRHAILEVNAFGDWLPNCTHDGLDAYATQVLCAMQTHALQSTLAREV